MSARKPAVTVRRAMLAAAALALTGGTSGAEPACGPETTVEAGETLHVVAGRCNVPVEAIVEANPDLEPDLIAIGQTLRLAQDGTGAVEEAEVYRVRPGDTLARVADTLGTTEEALKTANPDLDATGLEVGQEIRPPEPGDPGFRIDGVLTDEGGICQAMRGPDDALYSLVGDLTGYRSGDIVEVRGIEAENSDCNRGRIIEVEAIAGVE